MQPEPRRRDRSAPEASESGVDLTLIRERLRMTPTERIRAHDAALPLFLELARHARRPPEPGFGPA